MRTFSLAPVCLILLLFLRSSFLSLSSSSFSKFILPWTVTLIATRMGFFEVLLAFLAGVLPCSFSLHRSGSWPVFARNGRKGHRQLDRNQDFSTRLHHKTPVSPKKFNGDSESFRELVFVVELALRSNNTSDGAHQVDFMSLLQEGMLCSGQSPSKMAATHSEIG